MSIFTNAIMDRKTQSSKAYNNQAADKKSVWPILVNSSDELKIGAKKH
jgi:hypothetical protein